MSFVLPVMPDAREVIRSVLAAVGLTRVSTIDPEDTSTPWLRLTSAGGTIAVRQGLWAPRVDVSAYASTPPPASLLARQALTFLLAARNVSTAAGHLAGCDLSVGVQDLTDPTRTPPLYRQTFSVVAYLRP